MKGYQRDMLGAKEQSGISAARQQFSCRGRVMF
jgi:hypothetical protein